MKKAFDLATVRILLRRMVDKNYITIEDLDVPSPGWIITMEDAKRIPGFIPPVFRNPLRDEPTPTERVQITDPRDFPVVTAVADPVQRGSAPLPVAAHGSVAGAFSHTGLQGDEGRVGDAEDYGDEAHLGAAWEGSALGVGDFSDDW
jgi:hypothetical protein